MHLLKVSVQLTLGVEVLAAFIESALDFDVRVIVINMQAQQDFTNAQFVAVNALNLLPHKCSFLVGASIVVIQLFFWK